MKKYLALLMAAMMVLAMVAGCGNEVADDPGSSSAGKKIPEELTIVGDTWEGIDMFLIDS